MAGYIGTKPAVKGLYTVDEFTSSGGTTYTLSRTPGSKNSMQVSAGGLVQYPSAYSYSGTTLTLSGVPSGQKVLVRHFGDTTLYPTLDDNVVTGAKIALGSDAAGDTMYYNGTDYARLAKGTSGQALVMNSGATAPEWGSGLPTAGADGQVLTSDGTNWASEATAGGGKVLQVIQTHDTTARSQSVSTTRSVITGLNVTITPAATTSKIYITVRWVGELNHNDNHTLTWGIRRDSTDVGNPAADGSRVLGLTNVSQGYWNGNSDDTPDSAYMDYLDSPSTTSAITYHGTIWCQASRTLYTNRTNGNANNNSTERLASSITVWEIGA
jgi:hypothetical protein